MIQSSATAFQGCGGNAYGNPFAVLIDQIAFYAFRAGVLLDIQHRAVMEAGIAAQDMSAGDTGKVRLIEASQRLEGFVDGHDFAVAVENYDANGNVID